MIFFKYILLFILHKYVVSISYIKNIRHIFSDIDGTLLKNTHTLSSMSSRAIKRAIINGYNFFPATGRSRPSMARCLDKKVLEIFGGEDSIPGVYQQGLMVYDENGIIYERFIDADIIGFVESFCDKSPDRPTLVGYNENRVFCRQNSIHTADLLNYRDSAPEEFPDGLQKLRKSGMGIHKVILMHEPAVLNALRPSLTKMLLGTATITSAVPNMLEVLPFGASKGDGVTKLLDHYGFSREDAIAFGDGENDIEMFEAVDLSVAMMNAHEKLKEVASFITDSNEDDGVARIINKMVYDKRARENYKSKRSQ